VARFEEIKRLIEEGLSNRQVARSLGCRRDKVAEIRKGQTQSPAKAAAPAWAQSVDWDEVKKELGYKHALKDIWEEKFLTLTTYSNFWKYLYRKYPELRAATVTLRDFEPGERVEVDWAGGTLEWIELSTGVVHDAIVFVGCLGYSQLIFARASENMQSRAFLQSHRYLYEYCGGVPQVTVPDCTKTAVQKCHLYDPDLNPSYLEMARFYGTAIVPARPRHPKDKALVEGAVKLVMRMFRWLYRRHTFTSLLEINQALLKVTEKINLRPHTRFKVSRRDRWEKEEKIKLKSLPTTAFESVEFKQCVLHPDSTVSVDSACYSAPHIYRGKTLQVRLSESLVEIFSDTAERIAVHVRDRHHGSRRHIDPKHLPPNSQAYREATPQNVLSQARFVSADLYQLIDELFQKDALGHLRMALGLVRQAAKEIEYSDKMPAAERIKKAVLEMKLRNRIRCPFFRELLIKFRSPQRENCDRTIVRKPGNPMLRYPEQTVFPIT
jgi:transposase